MLYERIFKEFKKKNLNYVVIGGVAVGLHGYPRATGDLDIIILLQEDEIHKFIQAAKSLNLVPRLPVQLEDLISEETRKEWVEFRNMQVFSVYNPDNPLEHIDVKLTDSENFEKFIENRVIMKENEVEISVAHIDDLIDLKKSSGRERDLLDIKMLNQIKALRDEK